jgi:hypothetical protein
MIISHVVYMSMQQSLERQRRLNAYESKHGGTAVYGVNKFSDLTPGEFKSKSQCMYVCMYLY